MSEPLSVQPVSARFDQFQPDLPDNIGVSPMGLSPDSTPFDQVHCSTVADVANQLLSLLETGLAAIQNNENEKARTALIEAKELLANSNKF